MRWFLSLAVVLIAPTVFAADRPLVLLEEIKALPDRQRILVPAKVEAKVQSMVTADFEGHVTRVLKPIGAAVKAGEPVLYMENKDPGFTYAAVAVRAPVSGLLSQILPAEMSKVARGDKLFTVIDPKSMKVTAEIPASDLALVKAGLAGTFSPEMNKSSKLSVKVIGVSPLIDPRTGTAPAELKFDGTKDLPPIGTIGQLLFEVERGKIILVPESALSYRDGKANLRFLNKDGTTVRKPIELGEQRESQFVIKGGADIGEKIVVRTNRAIKEGEVVEIEKAATKTE